MTDADRHRPPAGSTPSDRGKLRLAAGLLALLAATLALRATLPPELVTPVLATLLFALAAGAALAAATIRDGRRRTTWLDAAGLLAYVGAAVSVMIEPEQFAGLVPFTTPTD